MAYFWSVHRGFSKKGGTIHTNLSIEGIFIAHLVRYQLFLRMQTSFTHAEVTSQLRAVALAFTLCAHDTKVGKELTDTQICVQTQQNYQLVTRSFDLSIIEADLAAAFENYRLRRTLIDDQVY